MRCRLTKFPVGHYLQIAVVLLLMLTSGTRAADSPTVEEQVRQIKAKYGVAVYFNYNRKQFFPREWLTEEIAAQGAQVSPVELSRLLPIIDKALARYPEKVLRDNLKQIYLLHELNFFGKSYGATNSRTALYIKSQGKRKGFTDEYLLGSIFHEFSSILMRNHDFPRKAWDKANESDFKYANNAVQVLGRRNLYDNSPEILERGFICNYAMTSMENDFNMLSSWLFLKRDKLERLAARNQRLRQKVDLSVGFYKTVDAGFRFGP